MTLHGLLKLLHLLSAVIWVGGMFFAILVLRPSLQALEPPQRIALHAQVFRRFFLIVWHVMPLVILTGIAMIGWSFGGMRNVAWPLHVMMLVGLIMGAVFVLIFFGPYRRFQSAAALPDKAAAVDAIRKLITVNLALGLLAIVLPFLG